MARFSASRLKAHMACGLAARYRYVDGLPQRQNAKASFGTVIHRVLEHYNQAVDKSAALERALEEFKDLWANPAKVGVEPDYWPKMTSYASLRTKGIEVIHRFHDDHRWQSRTVIGTEIPFLVPFGDHELTGFVDLVEIEKSGTGKELLKIVDYKTSSSLPNKAELALDVQFTAYAYAIRQREFWVGSSDPAFPGIVNGEWLYETVGRDMDIRCIWYALWNPRQIDAGPRTKSDFERLYRVCCEIEKATAADIAVPKIGTACVWCDYQEQCALNIPEALVTLQDPTDPKRWI